MRARSTPSPELLASFQGLLSDDTDDVAFDKLVPLPGLTESGYVFTTLEDRANRVCVTVNPDYYDRSLPKSAPLWLKGTAAPSQSMKRSDRIPAPKSTAKTFITQRVPSP